MSGPPTRYALGRLLRRREVWLPSWRGWLFLGALAMAGALIVFFGAYPFLAMHRPHAAGVMVVEGWLGLTRVPIAVQEYKARPYSACYVTGGPVDEDVPTEGFRFYADLGAARLREAGLPEPVAVPSALVERDRTYTSAVQLRAWLLEHGGIPRQITIFTHGVHARRSRLLFQKAFGDAAEIGVLPAPPSGYDPKRWFTSSTGVRDVVGEAIAYLYARLLFWPPAP
jgi:uncharacterized SAM-binding protein YcdF (DUF218 family)